MRLTLSISALYRGGRARRERAPRRGSRRLIVIGEEYRYIGIERREGRCRIVHARGLAREDEAWEILEGSEAIHGEKAELRLEVEAGGACAFGSPHSAGAVHRFIARPGNWVGARVGVFCAHFPGPERGGTASFGSFVVSG